MQRTKAVDFKLFLNYNFWLALVLPKLHPLASQRPVFYHSRNFFLHFRDHFRKQDLLGTHFPQRSLKRT